MENVPGEELFKVWHKTVIMKEHYKKTWGETIKDLTFAQKNKTGRFVEICNRFYNKICTPERDVYTGDMM